MSINGMSNPAFKGIYSVNIPKPEDAKDENEKKALEEAVINTVVVGFNASEAEPRLSADQSKVYFKINDKNDNNFENAISSIVAECNKQFGVDLANKVYCKKVSESDYNNAQPIE